MKEVFPDAVILRPSVVFGPEDDFFNRFAALARLSPALPLIGGGKTEFQPVFAGDVAKAVIAGTDRQGASRRAVYELGGPEILTMKEVMERVLAYTMRKRLLVSLPFSLAKLQGAILQILPNPPLTLDQVRLLEKRQCGERSRQARSAARSKDSASPSRSRSRPWCRIISSSIARRASSRTTSLERRLIYCDAGAGCTIAGWPGPQLPSGAGGKCAP